MTTRYAFLDIETTGLDPLDDSILEVAWAITDEHINRIGTSRTFIVEHGSMWGDVWASLRSAPQIVRDMHKNSGLEYDLKSRPAYPLTDIFEAFVDDVQASLPARLIPDPDDKIDVALAGFSIHFDADFLKRSPFEVLFTTAALGFQLSHRHYDLSAFKRGYKNVGMKVPDIYNPHPHRASADVSEAIEFARSIQTDLKFMHNAIESVLR